MSTAAHTQAYTVAPHTGDNASDFWEIEDGVGRLATVYGEEDEGEANAARFCALWNALAGLNPEAVKPALDALETMLGSAAQGDGPFFKVDAADIESLRAALSALRQPVTQA